MRSTLAALLTAGVVLGSAVPALAGMPTRAEATCPIDNRSFSYTTTASYSTFGSELDGRPIGSWSFPIDIPQCPDSRFPVYKDEWSAEERARMQALVRTPEYQSIAGERPYYVLYFVQRREDAGAEALFSSLLAATWQAQDDSATYSRYAQELIPLADAFVADPSIDAEVRPVVHLITANVLRQAGRFEEASTRLERVGDTPRLTERVTATRQLIEARDTRGRGTTDPRVGR